MRLLAWHCRSVAYTDGRRSTRPVATDAVGESFSATNVLLVFVTVEPGDRAQDLRIPARAVLELYGQLRPKCGVLLMPFAHLSSALAPPSEAKQTLASLGAEMRKTVEDSPT